MFALYQSYGLSDRIISLLFASGFGSSAVFGSMLGTLADKFGRKRFTQVYSILYIMSCLLMHVNHLPLLIIGRVLGGLATSLLYSVFDSWLCAEHTARKYPASLMSTIYTSQTFLNSISAILAGLVAQRVSSVLSMTNIGGSVFIGGYIAPFDLAIVSLIAALILSELLWSENYGIVVTKTTTTTKSSRRSSSQSDATIAALTAVSCLFESSMYIFVFKWSSALAGTHVDYGIVFSALMTGCMIGSQLFGLFGLKTSLVLAAVSHAAVAFGKLERDGLLVAFVMFEVAVGLYFPAIGVEKAALVSESNRTLIYTAMRVPMNVIVVACLLGNIGTEHVFKFTSAMLGVGAVLSGVLGARMNIKDTNKLEYSK